MRLVERCGKRVIFATILVTIVYIAAYTSYNAIGLSTKLGNVDHKNRLHSVVREAYVELDAILSRRYIAQLEDIRLQLSNKDTFVSMMPRVVEVFRAKHPRYFHLLKDRHPEVRTIFFNESISVVAPSLVKDYYATVVSNCTFYQPLVRNIREKCLNRFEDLEQRYLMSSVLEKENAFNFSNTNNFMHILTGALVTPDGDVIKDNLTIIPIRCQMIGNDTFRYFRPTRAYARHREVLTIAQFWGEGFFHFMVEDFPRIAAYLPFLKRHPEVKVHVAQTNGFTVAFLAELGIARSRVVAGYVKAGVLYMPAGTRCGRARLFNTQLLSLRLRAGLTEPTQPRDTIILIRRSKKRWFNNHDDILAMIRKHADPAGLEIVVYGDNPVPGIAESRRLFNRAYMVVGPHGAGMANLIFSQPGTILVEGMYYRHGEPNWCFRALARVLGHRYYGLLGKQCMLITASDVEPVVEYAVSKYKTTR